MNVSRSGILLFSLVIGLVATARGQTPAPRPTLTDTRPFDASVDSLKRYQAPQWYRDAKFGIWAHWGPQAVPGQGDWYARQMYIEGHPQYVHHLKTYGHPSKSGYKDIIPLWKAEKWDPEALMDLYAKAGAKYFVSMGVHHDNFDLWNSKHHAWNSVKMGPKRDVVGEWKKAATKHGLRFGVSEHLGASYTWFGSSHGSDKQGPMAGVPYDGADPKFAELYHPVHDEPLTGPFPKWNWYAKNPRWHAEWRERITDLLEQYEPDLLYTDGGIPFGDVGRGLVAEFYNNNAKRHGGALEAVYTHKNIGSGEFIREAAIQDVERGGMPDINPLAWQTDTSVGDWFYSEGYKYKTTQQVVQILADVVSKNGNLLLNVVLYADGSLPPEPKQFLTEMAAWMPINGEAIYGTRPWKKFGEGPTHAESGHFKEDVAYTPQDIRFTTKGDVLYAITLGVPAGQVRVTSLGTAAKIESRPVKNVELLGSSEPLTWKQENEALVITVPGKLPTEFSSAFRITF